MRNTGKLRSSKMLLGGKSLGGGGRLVSRKRIKSRSEKMQKMYEEQRRPFVQDFLERHPTCMFKLWVIGTDLEESPHVNTITRNVSRCMKRSEDVHEIFPRGRGGNIVPIERQNEEDQFLALCRAHHDFITTHPKWARERGYTR